MRHINVTRNVRLFYVENYIYIYFLNSKRGL